MCPRDALLTITWTLTTGVRKLRPSMFGHLHIINPLCDFV